LKRKSASQFTPILIGFISTAPPWWDLVEPSVPAVNGFYSVIYSVGVAAFRASSICLKVSLIEVKALKQGPSPSGLKAVSPPLPDDITFLRAVWKIFSD